MKLRLKGRGGGWRLWGVAATLLLLAGGASPAITGAKSSLPRKTGNPQQSPGLLVQKYGPPALAPPPQPTFDTSQPTEVTAVVGDAASLLCSVHNLAEKSVLWVRVRDLQILAHGATTFTADRRVSASMLQGAGTASCTLTIAPLRLNDSGVYECQINTDPKLSRFILLTVLEHATQGMGLKAVVSGARHQRVRVGSAVTLTCHLASPGAAPPFVPPAQPPSLHWLHDGVDVTTQWERGGMLVETEPGAAGVAGGMTSRLRLRWAGPADAGRYSCVVAGASPRVPDPAAEDTVTLQVDDAADYPDDNLRAEVMQRDEGLALERGRQPALSSSPWTLTSMLALCLFLGMKS